MPTSSTRSYLDQQTFAQQLDADGVNWFREENAGTARIWGLEGELQAEPVEQLHVDASFGYVNYCCCPTAAIPCCSPGNNCNGETCYSPRTPKFTSAWGCSMALPSLGGALTPRLDWTYQSKIYFVTNNGCFTETSDAGCGTGAQGAMACSMRD